MPHFPWEQYGIAGAVICVLFFILWRILVWVMKWVDKISAEHKTERESWLSSYSMLKNELMQHNERATNFHNLVTEAFRYVREEHTKMLDNQNKICNCLDKTEKGLTQIEQALGRINGYKHE